MTLIRPLPLIALSLLLAACSLPDLGRDRTPDEPPPVVTENPDDDVTRPLLRPGDGSDTPGTGSVPEPAADGYLGDTLAGLGAPTERGLWVTTGLVSAPQPGRIEAPSGGTLDVELRPSGAAVGAGSQISLQAMQALGLPLTELVTLRVFTR